MGIRFACHHCGKRLNIKHELAGRRGVCPECRGRFRIPVADAATSMPVESRSQMVRANGPVGHHPSAVDADHATQSHRVEVARLVDWPASELDVDQDATWYVRPPSGGQYGPASPELFKQWIAEGRVASTALVWRDGWPQWRAAASALPDLADRFPDGGVAIGGNVDEIVAAAHTFGYEPAGRSRAGPHAAESEYRGRPKRWMGLTWTPQLKLISILAVLTLMLLGILGFVASR